MITLHRLGHPTEEFFVNHDMIVSVEANPDTVIRLTGGDKIVVAESPAEVAEKVRDCRAEVMCAERCGWTRRRRAAAPPKAVGHRPDAALKVSLPPADPKDYEGSHRHRDRRCHRGDPAHERDDGGNEPRLVHQHPRADHHHRRHQRGDARQRRDGEHEADPEAVEDRAQRRASGLRQRVALLVSLAEQARREGLLALDAKLGEIDDEFTRKGLQLVVDGSDPALVREVLEAEIDGMATRHAAGATPFEKAGGFAPTMGIIGTVMGLVHVLQNLSAPATLGPSISTAFIATLMGVGSANVIFLPVANRLKAMSAEEIELRTLTVEGILSVQAGDNPRIVAEKLKSFIAPAERDIEEDPGRAGRQRSGRRAPSGRRPSHGRPAGARSTPSTRTRSAGCSPTPT